MEKQKAKSKINTRNPKTAKMERLRKLKNFLTGHPLGGLTPAETVPPMVAMAEIAGRDGILALDGLTPGLDDPFTRLGLQLLTDGTDPDLLDEILEARQGTLLAEFDRRMDIIRTAIVAMQEGGTPRLVDVKCRAFLP